MPDYDVVITSGVGVQDATLIVQTFILISFHPA